MLRRGQKSFTCPHSRITTPTSSSTGKPKILNPKTPPVCVLKKQGIAVCRHLSAVCRKTRAAACVDPAEPEKVISHISLRSKNCCFVADGRADVCHLLSLSLSQVIAAAKEHGVTLSTCLCTHRHSDHSGEHAAAEHVVLHAALHANGTACKVWGLGAALGLAGGNVQIKKLLPDIEVVASAYEDTPGRTRPVSDGDLLRLGMSSQQTPIRQLKEFN